MGIAAGTTPRPVRTINYIAYGANDVLGAGSMAVISAWVLIFYTKFCGLSAGQAALIFAVARILDAFASPTIGHLSDHFGRFALGRRFGRRRFFILAAIPLLPSFALMWLPGQTFWFYLVSYVLFELTYALEVIPYETLAAEMSSDFATKAKFAGARILFAQGSAILAGFLPLWLINWLGRDSPHTFFYMGALFAVLFMAGAASSMPSAGSGTGPKTCPCPKPRGRPLPACCAISPPRCASGRSGCIWACIWAAISARTFSTPPSPSL
jgi:oligogalacturonide transporter